MDKTLVYPGRSKSSPIDLSLVVHSGSPRWENFFEIIPQVIGRLKSLSINVAPENPQDIALCLSRPAPVLKKLSIFGDCKYDFDNSLLTPALFNGELSSLRKLHLKCVRTKLPWRNMVDLTSFTLTHASRVTIIQLLDFFENAPQLRKVVLRLATLTSGAPNGRFVWLAHLKKMDITDHQPLSGLLDHLSVPVGAKLTTQLFLHGFPIKDHLPRSLGNLGNFPNFTAIQLYSDVFPRLEFSGPNGQVTMISTTPQVGGTNLVLECLSRFDTSTTERLEHRWSKFSSRDTSYRALLPMKAPSP